MVMGWRGGGVQGGGTTPAHLLYHMRYHTRPPAVPHAVPHPPTCCTTCGATPAHLLYHVRVQVCSKLDELTSGYHAMYAERMEYEENERVKKVSRGSRACGFKVSGV